MVGLWKLAQNLFGSSHERHIKKLMPLVKKINALEPEISGLSDVQLADKTNQFKVLDKIIN